MSNKEKKTKPKKEKKQKPLKEKKQKNEKDKKDKKKKLKPSVVIRELMFSLKLISKVSPGILCFEMPQAILSALFGFLEGSFLIRLVVNSFESVDSMSKIITYVCVITGCSFVFWCISNAYNYFLWPRYYHRIDRHLNMHAFEQARRLELACYENPDVYDKYAKAMDNVSDRVYANVNVMWSLLNRIVYLSANTFLVLLIDPLLILFALLPLLLGFVRRKNNKLNHDLSAENKVIARKRDYVKRAFYLSENAKEMRLTSIGDFMFRKHKEFFKERMDLYRKYGLKRMLTDFIINWSMDGVIIVLAMLYSAYRTIVSGTMTAGDCIVVFNSISDISWSISGFVEDFAKFHENALFLEDYRDFMEYDPKIKDAENCIEAKEGTLRLENVTFRYDGSDKDVLKNINLELRPGEKIALVGQNGAGKSTLVKLLLRLYEPTEGKITLDGKDEREYTLKSWNSAFGVVFQECHPFSMTIAENVLLRPYTDADEETVIEALKQSGAYEKVASLPKGIHTVLTKEFDDEGTNLSGGELQKVELARIFATPTPFVILDEPSSALDPIAEHKMFENMMRACEDRTTVFISHRLSSATLADRVVLLDGGEIVECGTHKELMALGGKYAELFRMQAESYNFKKEVSADE